MGINGFKKKSWWPKQINSIFLVWWLWKFLLPSPTSMHIYTQTNPTPSLYHLQVTKLRSEKMLTYIPCRWKHVEHSGMREESIQQVSLLFRGVYTWLLCVLSSSLLLFSHREWILLWTNRPCVVAISIFAFSYKDKKRASYVYTREVNLTRVYKLWNGIWLCEHNRRKLVSLSRGNKRGVVKAQRQMLQ